MKFAHRKKPPHGHHGHHHVRPDDVHHGKHHHGHHSGETPTAYFDPEDEMPVQSDLPGSAFYDPHDDVPEVHHHYSPVNNTYNSPQSHVHQHLHADRNVVDTCLAALRSCQTDARRVQALGAIISALLHGQQIGGIAAVIDHVKHYINHYEFSIPEPRDH